MKSLLISLLLSMTIAQALAVIWPIRLFVRQKLYRPYMGVPGLLDMPHRKQMFLLALFPPGKVNVKNNEELDFAKKTIVMPPAWPAAWHQVMQVKYPLFTAYTTDMALWLSTPPYTQFTGKLPPQAHPDYTILKYSPQILRQFRLDFKGQDPELAIIYDYFSPCNFCTKEIIRRKKALKIPDGKVIVTYVKKYYGDGEDPDANIKELTDNGVIAEQLDKINQMLFF